MAKHVVRNPLLYIWYNRTTIWLLMGYFK